MSLVDSQGHDRCRGPPLLRRTAASTSKVLPAPPLPTSRPADRGGWLDHHAAARSEPLHLARANGAAEGQGSLSCDEARPRVDEAPDPDDIPEPGVLRESGVRHRGCIADLLLQARDEADALRVGPSRRAHAGALDLQPFHRAGAREARRAEVLRAMFETGVISKRRYAPAVESELALRRGRLYAQIREPYFFGYVRDRLIEVYGAGRSAPAACACTRRSFRATSGSPSKRSATR